MAKPRKSYVCNQCGYETAKWYGCCPSCGEWNTMEEEIKNTTNLGVILHDIGKISVPDNTNITAGANADVAAMRAGSTIPSQYVLFRIVSDIGDGTQKVFFALDGSDPRVEIVDTALYDSING